MNDEQNGPAGPASDARDALAGPGRDEMNDGSRPRITGACFLHDGGLLTAPFSEVVADKDDLDGLADIIARDARSAAALVASPYVKVFYAALVVPATDAEIAAARGLPTD